MKKLAPNDLGDSTLVEDCSQISISTFLKEAKAQLLPQIIQSLIEANGIRVKLLESSPKLGGTRYWFECPLCLKRCEKVFIHPMSQKLGCRKCLQLKYGKQRYKGMIEDIISPSDS